VTRNNTVYTSASDTGYVSPNYSKPHRGTPNLDRNTVQQPPDSIPDCSAIIMLSRIQQAEFDQRDDLAVVDRDPNRPLAFLAQQA